MRTWCLSEKALRVLARLAERAAVRHPNPRQDPAVARGAIERLVSSTSRAQHGPARTLIRQALAADMTKAPNRKGELPAALGLVSRSDPAKTRRHRAIVLTMDRVLETPIVDDSARCAKICERLTPDLPCPSRKECRRTFVFSNITQAAQAVVDGFYHAKIETALDPLNVRKIYERHWRDRSATTRR